MLGITGLASNRFRLFSVMLLSLLLFSGPHAAYPAAQSTAAPTNASSTASNEDDANASRLYQAVSGYVDGYHKPHTAKRTVKPGTQRRESPAAVEDHTRDRNKLEAEQKLAELRLQRQEWDLATLSLERVVKDSVVASSPEESEKLQRQIHAAKRNLASAADKSAAPGEVVNSVGMRLVLIPSGVFVMGTSPSELRRIQNDWNVEEALIQPESPAHKVTISRPFLMGKYAVTVGQFKKFVTETGYRTVAEKQGWGWVYDDAKKHWVKKPGASWKNADAKVADDYPVTMVCHLDAEAFCEWLSHRDGRQYFLPTEAQWEYAARGGKQGERFPWGNEYPDGKKLNMADRRASVPWADRTVDDGHGGVAPVGTYEPNGFWLYDMAGNVWQPCSDHFDPKAYESMASQTVADPTGPATGKTKVIRGGNWAFDAGIARTAFRFGVYPNLCTDMSGIRVTAVVLPGEESALRPTEGSALSNEHLARLLDKVKDLVASGKRLEARKLVEEFASKGPGSKAAMEDPLFFTINLLNSVIDITEDKGVQSFKNSLGMNMIRIPAGSFVMGSSETDIAWAMSTLAQGQPVSLENEFPFHKVRISRPFYISSTEVTVRQFRTFVEETGYVPDGDDAKGGQVFNAQTRRFEHKAGTSWKAPGWTVAPDQPVVMASYNDAQAFVEWLSAKEKLPYKLPTEAQWEYAARGGLPNAQFPWGDQLPDGRRANYADKNTDFEWRDRTADDGYKYVAPVGSYEPNGYGLYDMAGNALEWVRDYYGEDYYKFSPEIDPEGPGHGEFRVMKGGEWAFGPVNLRCAFRGWSRPDLAFQNSGFRVIIELSASVRPFHFSSNFLTKEWVPDSDHRAVSKAVADEAERSRQTVSRVSPVREKPAAKPAVDPGMKGLVVLNFSPKSDAKKSGIAKGDVIIEYDGARDLTADKFLAMTAISRREKTKPLVVFVRDGYEYSVRVNPGFLGVSVMDTVIRGPFKRPEPRQERVPEDDKDKKTKPHDWT
jgi:formylglycine-generating enzyme required for sulfatase activity